MTYKNLALVFAFATWLCASLSGCYKGTSPKPEVGSESHFLQVCARDTQCGELRCMAGICSKACGDDVACESLSSLSICERDGDKSGGSCDVQCKKDVECDALGVGYHCAQAHCRSDVDKIANDAAVSSSDIPERDAAFDGVDSGDIAYAHDAGVMRVDGGSLASLGCYPNPDTNNSTCPEICVEACDNFDNDCDLKIDEDDANDDCALPSATALCNRGSCVVVECKKGYADCDTEAANGCETTLNTLANCGGCNVPCTKTSCATGTCTN